MSISTKFKCYLIGTDSLLLNCAETLLNNGHQILGVISDSKKIIDWVYSNKLTIISPSINLYEELKKTDFDFLFSITNLTLLPDNLVSLPRRGSINFHDGPLPKYAGLNATSWAIINSEKTHGITWHYINSGVDKGEIIKQVLIDLDEDETALSLNSKCFAAGTSSFKDIITDLENDSIIPLQQEFSERSYFSKFKKPSPWCLIPLEKSAKEISAFVKALNFGSYRNPLGAPKIILGKKCFIVDEVKILELPSENTPGTIVKIDKDNLQIASLTNDISVSELFTLEGKKVDIPLLLRDNQITTGYLINNQFDSSGLKEIETTIYKKEEFWISEIEKISYFDLYYQEKNNTPSGIYSTIETTIPDNLKNILNNKISAIAAAALFFGRLTGKENYSLGFYSEESTHNDIDLLSTIVPFNIDYKGDGLFFDIIKSLEKKVQELIVNKTYIKDVIYRYPELNFWQKEGRQPEYQVSFNLLKTKGSFKPAGLLNFIFAEDNSFYIAFDTGSYKTEKIKLLENHLLAFLNEAVNNNKPLDQCSILTDQEKMDILYEWNATDKIYSEECIHNQFEKEVLLSSENTAAIYGKEKVSYEELNKRANSLANYLIEKGAGPEILIGLYLPRNINLFTSILAVLKSGSAYVPLDPSFPKDRIDYMIKDSACKIILTDSNHKSELPESNSSIIINLDNEIEEINSRSIFNPSTHVSASNLCYVIYTSGSTGKPKGVMVQHRNAVNFFNALDSKIPYIKGDSWLAVTSLSFDISVLELLWTLTRGFKVVLYAADDWKMSGEVPLKVSSKPINFSLFYFASDAGEKSSDKYRLLIEGSKYGDMNGFEAVWTPERHFHAFGGLYPNPSVTSAAIAAITKNIKIRAGSCVSPLHNPIRITEEWSFVDNLSNGRVGISFAAGWMPDDFVLNPQNYKDRKNIMFEQIDTVKKLWSGESVKFKNASEKYVEIRTLPRPIQKKLPIWITAAGNPETFQMTGEGGFNMLTHLLGQSIEELSSKVEIYRKAWKNNPNNKGEGFVTLMLHTFVGEDDALIKEYVRKPMKEYLKSSVDLIKKAAWSFPAFRDTTTTADGQFTLNNLSEAEMDVILDYSFERYYETSGLFGTPETCMRMVEKLKSAGIDEIACLIDFGIDSETVLKHLPFLNEVKNLSKASETMEQNSIPALIAEHNITHMQCTPSMAKMLTSTVEALNSLKKLKVFLIGGEAFPVNLAQQLKQNISADILNMYGPTETTIWSAIHKIDEVNDSIPIGRPIANTQIYILDKNLQPLPVGIPGELCIGGEGVVRGYYNQPKLTGEKFIDNPFVKNSRLYRTGDLAVFREDGIIEFLGRIDNQVKIRGYRIELGEIETILMQYPGIEEAVVIAREDTPGDSRLAGYIRCSTYVPESNLKNYLKEKLPEYMIPGNFIALDSFPLTPNGKIDRKSFPSPFEFENHKEREEIVLPENDIEEKIVDIWQRILKLPKVGTKDNFFDLGGHSLLAVQVHSRISEVVGQKISLVDIFRYPTIKSLVEHLGTTSRKETVLSGEKSENRKNMLQQRQARLQNRRYRNNDKNEEFD